MAARELIHLSEAESELVAMVVEAERFRDTCWEEYGPEWTEHLPQAVNAFVNHYFGTWLPPAYLALYYCPQSEATIFGGRGSCKTVSLALAMATYTALHPGEPWIHVSPVKDQAARTFEAIAFWGNRPLGHPNFFERFVDSVVTAPFHEIRLKAWDAADPGQVARFRPLAAGDIEYLRSLEAGTITVDEAFRDVPNPEVYPQLRGCIRGINEVRKAILPTTVVKEIDDLRAKLAAAADPKDKNRISSKLERLYVKHGLARRGLFALYGNVAGWDWCWERYDQGATDPEHFFSLTVTTRDNPFLDRKSIQDMERSYGNNTALREIEMEAKRPLNTGGIFVTVAENIDRGALPQARAAMAIGRAIIEEVQPVGLFHYELPPDPTHFYVMGADPGAGIAPGRNKWVILAYDLAVRPVPLVYFRMGHINRAAKGNTTAFWDELKRVAALYSHYPGDIWVESTANQKGQAMLAFPTGVDVTPVSFSGSKPALVNQLRMLLDRRVFALPAIPAFLIEHGNYQLPDKDLNQDIVMANICAAGALWRYIDLDFDLKNVGAPNGTPAFPVPPPAPRGRYDRPEGARPYLDQSGVTPLRLGSTTDVIWVTATAGEYYVG